MGCDGGTIPRRDELVKVKKKPEAKDKDAELGFQWQCCSITQQVLQKPIVMCGYGRLYNKLSLIEALLNRDTLPDSARHIKSLKDVKQLNLTPNPAYKEEDKKEGTVDGRSVPFICPVIGLEMSGKFRFVALWSCGCAFSERSLKEIKTTTCHKCQKPFTEDDVVILNAPEEEQPLRKERINIRKVQNKKNKDKSAKVKIENCDESVPSTSKEVICKEEPTEKLPEKPTENEKATSTVSASTSSINQKGKAIKRPGVNGSLAPPDNRGKKAKSDYSVAKDPQASDVYKSLFTSHKSEKEQNRAHWVTYNPFYN